MTSGAPSEQSAPRRVDASPFDLSPAAGGDGAGALCIHGLTGTPYEVRPVAEALAAAGVRARGLLLPGHNTTPETLARVSGDDWLVAVRDAYRRLREEHDRVLVVGVSLGGVLSLRLAREESVAGLVVIGTPLRLAQPIPLVVPWLKHLVTAVPKRGGSDIRDPEARARHPGYREMPLAAVHELIRLQETVRGSLSEITAPTLVAHGRLDQTANPADAETIHEGIGSTDRELVVLEDSGHVVPVDHDGPELSERVVGFAKRVLAAG